MKWEEILDILNSKIVEMEDRDEDENISDEYANGYIRAMEFAQEIIESEVLTNDNI